MDPLPLYLTNVSTQFVQNTCKQGNCATKLRVRLNHLCVGNNADCLKSAIDTNDLSVRNGSIHTPQWDVGTNYKRINKKNE